MPPILSTILPYVLLIFGFFILIKGADFFVEGSSSIAKKLRIPDIIVGLTIVAMGTSAPELAVSVSAALGGSSDISIGNAVGSNLLNILIILGISAVIVPMTVDKSMFKRDFPVLLVSAVLLPALCLIFGNHIGRIAALILLLVFAFYIFLAVKAALDFRKNGGAETEEGGEIKVLPWWKSILFTIGGAVVIVIGGNISVDNATIIAHQLGISEAIIGLTVVALGTSLPELVTSIVAARKGNSDIALGNVVGSNIFNVLLILGTTAMIKPFDVTIDSLIDQAILLVVSIMLFIMCLTGTKLTRWEGAGFLAMYVGYAVYIFVR